MQFWAGILSFHGLMVLCIDVIKVDFSLIAWVVYTAWWCSVVRVLLELVVTPACWLFVFALSCYVSFVRVCCDGFKCECVAGELTVELFVLGWCSV